jgi:hypothetical protein
MNAKIDENGVNTIIATLNTDGISIMNICINDTNSGLCVNDGTTGTDEGNNDGNAMRDENSRPVLLVESSDGNGDLVELYADSDGKLLIQST